MYFHISIFGKNNITKDNKRVTKFRMKESLSMILNNNLINWYNQFGVGRVIREKWRLNIPHETP